MISAERAEKLDRDASGLARWLDSRQLIDSALVVTRLLTAWRADRAELALLLTAHPGSQAARTAAGGAVPSAGLEPGTEPRTQESD